MRSVLFVLVSLCAAEGSVWAQRCFQWQLESQVVLHLHVEAYDTVAIVGDPVFFRHRNEQWTITCDSTRGDTIFLRQRLDRYWAHEWTQQGDSNTRTTIRHVGATTNLVLTRRGWRVQASSTFADSVSVVPGSTFGPVFLVPLDSTCTRCGGPQWLVEQRDSLVEYAVPPALLERLYLGSVDSCSADGMPRVLSFAETSSGEHLLPFGSEAMKTTVWTLAHGVIELDTTMKLPRQMFYAVQQRLRIVHLRSGNTRDGTQRTSLSAQVEVSYPATRPR